MKKYLALVLGVLFVFVFAVSSFADVTMTGEIKMWNWYRDNMSPHTSLSNQLPISTPSQAFSMTRVRLGADIKVADNVKGMIEIETSGTSGISSDYYQWGSLNSKVGSSLNLRQAWILYTGSGLLGIPAGLKMGHMPLMLGLGKFFNNTRYGDDAIVFFVDPNKQLHLGLVTFKVYEGSLVAAPSSNAQDIDVYAAVMAYKIDDKNNFGLNYVRINDQQSIASLRQFQNVMLHGSFNVGGLKIGTELDTQFGKLNDPASGSATKAAGYLIYVDLGYKVDPVGIRAAYALGSGDKSATDNKNGNFINFLGPDMNVAFIYEYQVKSASGGNSSSGLTNTTMYNVGLDLSPTKDLGLSLDGYLFRASKSTTSATGSSATGTISKKVGSEIDLKAKYNVAKGLTWTVLAGYFNPGQFYKDAYLSSSQDKKTATAVRSDLTLNF